MISLVNKVKTARQAALTILEEVFLNGAYSNIALNQALLEIPLSSADQALVTEIVYGTVARKMTLEWYLSHVIKDREKLDSWVYILLLLSLYQIHYLDKIPAHAVVNEAAELAKARKKGSEKFVNAVLRGLLRDGVADIASIKRKNKRYSVQYSLPVWLVKVLIEEYGETRALAIFESLFLRNKASIRVVDLKCKEELKERLQAEDSLLTTGQVIALDLYDHKLRLIEENAKRLGVADRVITKKLDARRVFETFGVDAFDKILVDAPCSGIGLIRRKPDIKYNKENADFTSLQKIQLEILDSVCQSLRKGGIITYSTCTIVSQENFQVVEQFLAAHPNFEQVKLEQNRRDILQDGCILITPELYGSDGFFISQFKRIS